MGLRFRKSINLGGGFRINLSKSGVGYSWGITGYRKTTKVNGGTRTTYSLPGTGISYVDESGNNSLNYNKDTHLITGETTTYQNTNITQLGKDDLILQSIKKLRKINLISNIFLWLTLLAFSMPPFCLCLLVGIILKILLVTKWKIDLTYEFDDYSSKKYECLKNVMSNLSNSKKIWQINTSTKVYNTKYNAGAGQNITRYNITLNKKLPFYIKHNIEIYSLNLKGEKMIFTPDRILYFKGFTNVYGRDFKDMYIGVDDTRFIESGMVPKDAEIIDYTWKYVNKNGGPDKRFNDNRRLPICRYGELVFKTEDGINICIEYSNVSLLQSIQQAFIEFASYHNEEIEEEKRKNGELHPELKNPSKKGINKKRKINDTIIDKELLEIEPLYDDIVDFVINEGKVSASLLQRKFRLGYNRACYCIDLLEENGIIDVSDEKGTRKVLKKGDIKNEYK